jgi:hypothetical protein
MGLAATSFGMANTYPSTYGISILLNILSLAFHGKIEVKDALAARSTCDHILYGHDSGIEFLAGGSSAARKPVNCFLGAVGIAERAHERRKDASRVRAAYSLGRNARGVTANAWRRTLLLRFPPRRA